MLQPTGQQKRIWSLAFGAVALGLAVAGCGGGDDSSNAPKTDTGSGTRSASGEGGSAGSGGGTMGGGMMSGGGGMMSGGGGMMAGMGGPGGGSQQPAAATAKPKNTAAVRGFRPDPLRPWWDTTPKPPPVLSYVDPIRIAIPNSAAEEKPAGVEIQEVPSRRVAGILTGNGVYALIDDFNGKAEVVKPGQVLDDGYRVVSINANSVVLKKVVDNRTYTQTVPLTDAGSTSTFSAPAGGRPGGMPGMPGSGGGRMGLPGMPGAPGAGRGGFD